MDLLLEKGAKVAAKANAAFEGTVIEAAEDGLSGYVHFSDEEGMDRVFFHVSELEILEYAPEESEDAHD